MSRGITMAGQCCALGSGGYQTGISGSVSIQQRQNLSFLHSPFIPKLAPMAAVPVTSP